MILLTRDQFREGVFARDGHRCVFCGEPAQEIAQARANVVALAESFHELNGKFDKVFGKLTAGR